MSIRQITVQTIFLLDNILRRMPRKKSESEFISRVGRINAVSCTATV